MNFSSRLRAGARRMTGILSLGALLCSGGCGEQVPHSQEPVSAASTPATAAPRVCVSWRTLNGATPVPPVCMASNSIADAYARGQREPSADHMFDVMYAERPSASEVGSVERIQAWFAVADRILVHLKEVNAAAVLVSGTTTRLAHDARSIRGDQASLVTELERRVGSAVNGIAEQVSKGVDKEKAPHVARLGKWKAAHKMVQPALQYAQKRLDDVGVHYRHLLQQHQSYRASEAEVQRKFVDLANRGSAATLELLPRVEFDLKALRERDELTSDAIIIDAARVQIRLAIIGGEYELRAAPYREFFEELGKTNTIPDAIRAMSDAAGAIDAYAQARARTVRASSEALQTGLTQRETALKQRAVDDRIAPALAQARLTTASNQFLQEANEKARALGASPPRSTVLKFPFYADVVEAHQLSLEYEPVCASVLASDVSWMIAGCNVLTAEFGKSRNMLSKGIPNAIRFAVSSFQRSGVPAERIADMQGHLTAGRIREAAIVYDRILRDTDRAAPGGTP